MTQDLLKFLTDNPGYLKWGKQKLADKFNTTVDVVLEIKRTLMNEDVENDPTLYEHIDSKEWEEFQAFKLAKTRRASKIKKKLPLPYKGGNPNKVLVIGDLHEPFSRAGYIEFVRQVQEDKDCGTVVFIGDIIDNHYSSYHETETNAMGADDELEAAIMKIQQWYSVFPEAFVCIGNHDRMAFRKAKTSGVSSKWVRDYDEVLGTPGWQFVEEIEIDGVNYNHGEGGTAKVKMKNELQSQVQGHLHAQAYIEFSTGKHHIIFGMQVGCGVDDNAYAMAYGKNFKKSTISCGVVTDGLYPELIPMKL
jgi:predicted phosphodiesterase